MFGCIGFIGDYGLTNSQGHIEAVIMMMNCQFHSGGGQVHPVKNTDIRQVTDTLSHVYGLCPVRVPNPGRRGVKTYRETYGNSTSLR